MIPKKDRIPSTGKDGWRKLTVQQSSAAGLPVNSTIVAKVEYADEPTQIGTPVNRASEIEYLAASGTTAGTSSAFTLAQPGFTLFDGALIRLKFHVAPAASFTINVENTNAIQASGMYLEAVGSGWNVNTWTQFIYSSTLNKWILAGGGGQVADNLTSTSITASLSANMGRALRNANAIGENALISNTTGQYNTAFGISALQKNTTGPQNTAVGFMGMQENLSGGQNIAIGTYTLISNTSGSSNIAIGNSALPNNTQGNGNTAVGAGNVLLFNATANYNTAVGYSAATMDSSANSYSNSTCIGANSYISGSNQVSLGNNQITQLRCNVQTISSLSDSRLKEDIERADTKLCLEAVKNLPITRYKYKDFVGTKLDKHVTGWMADDVEKVFPKAVQLTDEQYPMLDENGQRIMENIERPDGTTEERPKMFTLKDVKSITMTEALPTLWGAVQALLQRVEYLEATLKDRR